MLDLSNTYVIAVIIAFIATAAFHFDQKQKKNEVENMSYVKVFSLVFISIVIFNYIKSSQVTILDTVKTITETTTPTLQNNLSGTSSIINNVNPYSNLKIREGPPDF